MVFYNNIGSAIINKKFMNIITKSLILSVFCSILAVGAVSPVKAATPVLSATYTSVSSGNVQITVSNANSNSQINFFTRQSSSLWTEVKNIGQTDYNGYFNQVISLPSDGTSSSIQMYVVVAGLQSSVVSVSSFGSGGCTYNCGSPYGISLSQNNLSLTQGQSATATIYSSNNYYSSYYIASNSNSNVVSASISGNVISVNALSSGSGSINICQNASTSNCTSLYVTVTGGSSCSYYGCSGSLSLSQANLNLTTGQNSTVNIYSSTGYSGSYYISSNTNPNYVSASISGSTVYVNALNSGSSVINICQSNSSACISLYVLVSGSGCGYTGCNNALSLSQSNLSLNVGQSASVSVYNYGGGSLYISSNSNSSVVSATVSGSSINLYGIGNGIATVSVCAYNSSQCGTIYVTVSGSSTGGNIWFSTSNPSLSVGQSLAVSINSSMTYQTYPAYSNAYYISSNSSSSVVSASVSGTVLNLNGLQSGSSSISVCHTALGFCSTVYVTVSGSNYGGNLTLSQYNLALNQGQSATVNIYGSGSYYVSSNSNSYVASASLSGGVLNIYASQAGSTTIAVCQSGYSSCVNLYVTVSGYSYGGGGLQYPGGNVLGTSAYPSGQLISEGGTVYMVYKNTKTGFSSASVFTGLGFKFSNVLPAGYSNLNNSGYIVTSAHSSHPWGTWIKNGASTVYFVHESGLIPVPDWGTFIANGGQASFIVSANSADFTLPILTVMANSDSRLK